MNTVAHTPLLQVDQLTVYAGDKCLLRDLSWQVKQGEFWCVVGKNGAGKSTLLHTLAGLVAPHSGTIVAQGKKLSTLSSHAMAKWRGLLLQSQTDVFSSTVLETVLIGRHPYHTGWGWADNEDQALAQAALVHVNMLPRQHDDILQLSGGERQRVALATLLVQDPAILMLDEPTSHQDMASQIAMMELIRLQSQTHGVIAVCHDVNLVSRFATHVLLLTDHAYYKGPVDDVLHTTNLEATFDCPFEKIVSRHGHLFVPISVR